MSKLAVVFELSMKWGISFISLFSVEVLEDHMGLN